MADTKNIIAYLQQNTVIYNAYLQTIQKIFSVRNNESKKHLRTH